MYCLGGKGTAVLQLQKSKLQTPYLVVLLLRVSATGIVFTAILSLNEALSGGLVKKKNGDNKSAIVPCHHVDFISNLREPLFAIGSITFF